MLFKDPLNVAPVAKEIKSTDDEVKKLREIVKKLQIKCNQTASELQDLTRESND